MCVQNRAVRIGAGESPSKGRREREEGKGGSREDCGREHLGTPKETSLGKILEGRAGPSC